MLSRKRRVNSISFPIILKKGTFLHSKNFYLILLKNDILSPTLFSFVVPLKVSKKSTIRHFLKRRMSMVVEKLLINIKDGYSCLFFAKNGALKSSYLEIEEEITEILKKSSLLN